MMSEPLEVNIRKMLRAGKSGRQIAKDLGCSYTMVLRIRDEAGIQRGHYVAPSPVEYNIGALQAMAASIARSWTPIAWRERMRSGGGDLRWTMIPGAPVDLASARNMVERGLLIMAQRHEDERVTLLVRRASL